MKNTLTTHISRILVVLLHFFNDVNVKTSSCYIFSMLSKHLLVTFFHSLLRTSRSSTPHNKDPSILKLTRPSTAGPFHAPSLAGGMGQVAGRGCYRCLQQGSPQKFKQTFCIRSRCSAQCSECTLHTARCTLHTHTQLKNIES